MSHRGHLFQQLLDTTAAIQAQGGHHRISPARQRSPSAGQRERDEGPRRALLSGEILALRGSGMSYGEIAMDLNRRGIRSRNGGRWYNSSVRSFIVRHGSGAAPDS